VYRKDRAAYLDSVRAMKQLLAPKPQGPVAQRVPARALGEKNSIYQLRNYVVGLGQGGLQLGPDGSIDRNKSFRRIDYLGALTGLRARNTVQAAVSDQPVDFIAVRLPGGIPGETGDAVWLYSSEDRQSVVVTRAGNDRRLELRYLPVARLKQNEAGHITFDRIAFRDGLPLHIREDPSLDVPSGTRDEWLAGWHTEDEWLQATHRTVYSGGILAISEFGWRPAAGGEPWRRFASARRRMVEADLLLLANDHWNFNVVSYNPGGNHGSFFRISMRAAFLIAGGQETGIPKGRVIDRPYDGLSVTPTILRLMSRRLPSGRNDGFPGPEIQELFPDATQPGKLPLRSGARL
jgi:hypothetical protein